MVNDIIHIKMRLKNLLEGKKYDNDIIQFAFAKLNQTEINNEKSFQ